MNDVYALTYFLSDVRFFAVQVSRKNLNVVILLKITSLQRTLFIFAFLNDLKYLPKVQYSYWLNEPLLTLN